METTGAPPPASQFAEVEAKAKCGGVWKRLPLSESEWQDPTSEPTVTATGAPPPACEVEPKASAGCLEKVAIV